MPAKRMTASTAAASSIPGGSASTTTNNVSNGSNLAPGAGARPLETLNGMTRLTPARDLTLGGRGAAAGGNKKVFAPNLNAVRNKNTNVKTSKDTTQPRGGRRGGRGNGAGATRGRGGNSSSGGGGGNSTLIQTQGLFSEGAGDVHVRRSTGNGTAYARAGEEVAVARKRVDRKDDRAQAQRINELLGESDDSDAEPNDEEDNKTEMALKPILLKEGLWSNQALPLVKQEVRSSSPNRETLAVAQHLQQLHVARMEEPPLQYGRYPRSIGNFLDSSQSQIFLMQLPDVLPCVSDEPEDAEPPNDDSTMPPSASETEPTSPAAGKSTNAAKGSVLRLLEEGQIGKILRYRSGRVKLQLGDTLFDLDMGLDPGYLQELMSVTANREQRSGNMINLGPIQAKLKATPDWVHLFEQQEAAAKRSNPLPNT
ncbi:hypothetical protein KR059_012808 [Drosophila kikkawai]|nr:hypothetical protein KR059_012808 [Drosophila kikkawai]